MIHICVPIMVRDFADAMARAHAAKDSGADMIELRIDEIFQGDLEGAQALHTIATIEMLLRDSPLPCILTCRSSREGGQYDGDEDARISLLERLGMSSTPPAYIDIEAVAYEASANIRQKIHLVVRHPGQLRDSRAGLILSTHDFQSRPTDLLRRIARMAAAPGASVIKVAYAARSLRDALELLDLATDATKPTIALGMGDFGVMTRILAPKFGAFLTFASLGAGTETAPGQLALRDLLNTYRARSITAATKVFGIVGWPVSHSLSPLVHNAGFDSAQFDGVYVPMPIAANDSRSDTGGNYASLKGTLLDLCHHPRLTFAGCSVTVPHKESLAQLAREQGWQMDEASFATGAANTLIWQGDAASARVLNTDAPALVRVLTAAMVEARLIEHEQSRAQNQIVASLANIRVAILGAGGVARAAAWALANAGATVVVYARNKAKAELLANELNAQLQATLDKGPSESANCTGRIVPAAWDLLSKACANVLVNCTPVGMRASKERTLPEAHQAPVEVNELTACVGPVVVMDTVYTPRQTPLLKAARERGWTCVDGVGMFIAQAALQFEAWTGTAAPVGIFTRIVDEALAAREVGSK